jgi:hypothetical protein
VVANPKPEESVCTLNRKGAIVQRDAGRPDFLTQAIAEFLELQ